MKPYAVILFALACGVCAAYVGLGREWGAVVQAVVAGAMLTVGVLAAEPWKAGRDG